MADQETKPRMEAIARRLNEILAFCGGDLRGPAAARPGDPETPALQAEWAALRKEYAELKASTPHDPWPGWDAVRGGGRAAAAGGLESPDPIARANYRT